MYDAGKTHVRQNAGMGISLTVDYGDGTAWVAKDESAEICMESMKQLDETHALIEKYCPKAMNLWDND